MTTQGSSPQRDSPPRSLRRDPAFERPRATDQTAELQAALVQARYDLMEADRLATAGRLVGAISHDLRQPLTSFQMNLDTAAYLLRQQPPQIDRALAALADANAEANGLRDSIQLLEDLVARHELHRTNVSLESIVADVTRLLRSAATARHVTLDVACDASLPAVYADRTMVRETVMSLLMDAVENVDPAHDARVNLTARSAGESVDLCIAHRRLAGKLIEDGWALSVARSVADAHGTTLRVETRNEDIRVTTTWPMAIAHTDNR